MPKQSLRDFQQEIQRGLFWPLYWVIGPERLMIQRSFERLRKAVGIRPETAAFQETFLDATDADAAQVVDAARSLFFGTGTRLVRVRDVQLYKNPEVLAALWKEKPGPLPLDQRDFTVFAIASEWDARKKFSKQLLEHAVVLECGPIDAKERSSWIRALSKEMAPQMPEEEIQELATMLSLLDPWSLGRVEMELKKWLAASREDRAQILTDVYGQSEVDAWFEAFMKKERVSAIEKSQSLYRNPDEVFPWLGLLTWSLRQVIWIQSGESARVPPWAVRKLSPLVKQRPLGELLEIQKAAQETDFTLKQKPHVFESLWTELLLRFT